MDIFGVGSTELLVFLIISGVLLGPRRIRYLVRESRKIINQIQALTRELAQELNREIDLMELAESDLRTSVKNLDKEIQEGAGADDAAEKELPEAYLKFREDFPEEGDLSEHPSTDESAPDQPVQPVRKESMAAARSNALAGARGQPQSKAPAQAPGTEEQTSQEA